MKIIKQYFILLLILFQAFVCNAGENDSLPQKERKALLGFIIAPNLSWRIYSENKQLYNNNSSKPEKEQPGFGYSIFINKKIIFNRFVLNLGTGFSCFNYRAKYSYEVPPRSKVEVEYNYQHLLIAVPIGLNRYIGKKRIWYVGINSDACYLIKLTQNFETKAYDYYSGILINENQWTYDFTKPMLVFMGGCEFGKNITVNDRLKIDISLNAKYSSTIYPNKISRGTSGLYVLPRNLITSTLNISFYPIFKKK